jgi:hypothetical protein
VTDVIERYLAESGAMMALLSFRNLPQDGLWLMSPLGSQLLGYNVIRGEWPSNLDALFFIRMMYATTPAVGPGTQ